MKIDLPRPCPGVTQMLLHNTTKSSEEKCQKAPHPVLAGHQGFLPGDGFKYPSAPQIPILDLLGLELSSWPPPPRSPPVYSVGSAPTLWENLRSKVSRVSRSRKRKRGTLPALSRRPCWSGGGGAEVRPGSPQRRR